MEYHRIKKVEQSLEVLLEESQILFLRIQSTLEDLRIALMVDEKELDQSLEEHG